MSDEKYYQKMTNNRASKARTKKQVFLDSNSRLFARKSKNCNGNIRLQCDRRRRRKIFRFLTILKAFPRQFFLAILRQGGCPANPPLPSYATGHNHNRK